MRLRIVLPGIVEEIREARLHGMFWPDLGERCVALVGLFEVLRARLSGPL